jgi:hypothetical protein
VARADGSAENVLMKLDGGMDLNAQLDIVTQAPGTRDHPPGSSHDKFLGYEQMKYVRRVAEKFAARDTARNVIGSPGAETYRCTIGTDGFVVVNGGGFNTTSGTVAWAYHNPTNAHHDGATPQFDPPPAAAADTPVELWLKIGYQYQPNRAYLYYTTNGTNPEGSGGVGRDQTQVVALNWVTNGPSDGTGVPDWWKATLPALPAGTELRYKLGALNLNAPSVFPWSDADLDLKYRMETVFEITNFNAATIPYYPHNDLGRAGGRG